ncbi:multidrug MFS transporter [Bifidobacterium thermophilum]|nr:multidrug MFS transporter [Bifidobacterium thermophilum]
MRIFSGIVTYNPEIERLRENITSIAKQTETVIVADNGSKNIDDIKKLLQHYNNVCLVELHSNKGIAAALNVIMQKASDCRVNWVLLMDQDSVATENMIAEMLPYVAKNVGIVSPVILDRNKGFKTKDTNDNAIIEVTTAARKGIITAGSLTNVCAWSRVGGFDEYMFIDYVDYDFNERLLLNGYKLLKVNRAKLIQEVGNAKPTWLYTPRKESDGSWKIERFYAFGHSPMRCYYKARNRIYYTKKYGKYVLNKMEGVYQIPIQMMLVLLFENNKHEKMKMFIKGVVDGTKKRVERYHPLCGA